MSAAGTNSSWETSKTIDTSEILHNPTQFSYELVYDNGTTKSITISGDSTLDDLVKAINAQTGRNIASLDPTTGALKLDGVQSFKRRDSSTKADTLDTLKVYAGTQEDMSKPLVENGTGADLTFDILVDKGLGYQSTVSITVKDTATREEFLATLAQATGNTTNMSMDKDGSWYLSLSGVVSITPRSGDLPDGISAVEVAGTSASSSYNGDAKTTFNTTLTFTDDKLDKALSDKTPPTELVYTFTKSNGDAFQVRISSDATNRDLLDAIKSQMPGEGINITEGTDASGNATLALEGIRGMTLTQGYVSNQGYSATVKAEMVLDADKVSQSAAPDGSGLLEAPPDITYTLVDNDGQEHTFSFADDGTVTLQQVIDAINADADLQSKGITATFTADPAGGTTGSLAVSNIISLSGKGLSGQITDSDNWNIKQSANAIYTVDNWPMELESASNSVTDVIEGVTFNIQGVGEATINVNTDVDALQESVQSFLDAVNSLLVTIQTFTAYDENAETTTSDPEDDNYSMSQLTAQKGGLLQGNYGVQLFNSRFKSVLSGTPAGYQSRASATDLLSGDLLSNLANMGIKTDTDQNSDTYGMLVVAPQSTLGSLQELDQENYNTMLTENMEAVVDFFCGPSSPGTTSTNEFRYASSIQGITQAGIYDVSYEVDSAGNILEVYINGSKASNDPSMGSNYFTCGEGDARGLAIIIDDLTPGKHEGGQVRVKYGLLDTVDNFLKAELTWQSTGTGVDEDSLAIKSQNGALMILQDNYKTIMENIQDKIDKEQTRISTWEASSRRRAISAPRN